jgi:ribosomal protein S12 methylthiotransferase
MLSNNIHIISLGCPKNRVDTEAVMGQLAAEGYRFTSDINNAGTVLVNTCGFLQEAVAEGLAEIAAMARHKERLGFRLVVTGCLVQRMGRSLKREIPEIDSLIGVHGYDKIAEALASKSSFHNPRAACNYQAGFYNRRLLTTGPGWAYLRIADGCDNRCSYCLIPSIRGKFRSRPMPDIIKEARLLAQRGVKEINLIAQDTTAYGSDIYGRRSLPGLLKALCKVDGIEWIRILYTHPAHFDEKLIETVAAEKKIVKYLDIPLQHISGRILKSMGRKVDSAGIISLLHRIRSAIPEIVLRTTFIVGFPGETDNDFEQLCDFVREMKLDRVGVFAYSPESGTRAARMSGRVEQGIKRGRLDRLMRIQNKVSSQKNRNRIGQKVKVLLEDVNKKDDPAAPYRKGYHSFGRSYGEAPEIDGKIYINNQDGLTPGRITEVFIEKAWAYDLGGSIIKT